MRILVLLSSLYTGGAEFSTLSFYGWLRKNGYDIKVVCIKRATPSFSTADFGLDSVVVLESQGFVSRFFELRKIIREFKPSVLHSTLFEANLLGRFERFFNPGFVHLESLVNEMYSPHRFRDPRVNRIKLRLIQVLDFVTQGFGVDHFHANGESVAKHYQQKLSIARERISIIPRGRKENLYPGRREALADLRKELNPEGRVMFINVGRQEYQKGQDILIKAMHHLGDEHDRLLLIIAGREGNLTGTLKADISRYQLDKSVRLLGHRGDVAQLLAVSDVFVFSSRFEGLPGALIEAESAGLPILCSAIENNREVALEGENALFFDVDNSVQLSELLLRLSKDTALRERMGAESKRIFLEKFEEKKIFLRMKDLIDKVSVRS